MLTIIGCGNANRNDDSVGVIVAQRLQQYLAKHPNQEIRIFDAGTAGMDVMFQARGSDALIIIDASSTGSESGAVYEVPGHELEAIHEPSLNLHDFRWDNALYAGRQIFKDDFPEDVMVYLIEAKDLSFGLELSKPVDASAEKVYESIKQRIETYSNTTSQV